MAIALAIVSLMLFIYTLVRMNANTGWSVFRSLLVGAWCAGQILYGMLGTAEIKETEVPIADIARGETFITVKLESGYSRTYDRVDIYNADTLKMVLVEQINPFGFCFASSYSIKIN